MPASARHETRALLRAHLSAASGYRHLTRRCAVCHQLQRLAMEPSSSGTAQEDQEDDDAGHPLLESRPAQDNTSGAIGGAGAGKAVETAQTVEAAAPAIEAADATEA